MDILFLTKDIMFSALVLREAQDQGKTAKLVVDWPTLQDALLSDPPQLLILDVTFPGLAWPLLGEALARSNPRPRVIAYGPHVFDELLAMARAAGCDQVLTKGQFHREVKAIVG